MSFIDFAVAIAQLVKIASSAPAQHLSRVAHGPVRALAPIQKKHDIEDLSAIACHWVNPRKSPPNLEISCQKKLHILGGLCSTCTNM